MAKESAVTSLLVALSGCRNRRAIGNGRPDPPRRMLPISFEIRRALKGALIAFEPPAGAGNTGDGVEELMASCYYPKACRFRIRPKP